MALVSWRDSWFRGLVLDHTKAKSGWRGRFNGKGVRRCEMPQARLLRYPCNSADVCGLIRMRQMARVATVTRSPYR